MTHPQYRHKYIHMYIHNTYCPVMKALVYAMQLNCSFSVATTHAHRRRQRSHCLAAHYAYINRMPTFRLEHTYAYLYIWYAYMYIWYIYIHINYLVISLNCNAAHSQIKIIKIYKFNFILQNYTYTHAYILVCKEQRCALRRWRFRDIPLMIYQLHICWWLLIYAHIKHSRPQTTTYSANVAFKLNFGWYGITKLSSSLVDGMSITGYFEKLIVVKAS